MTLRFIVSWRIKRHELDLEIQMRVLIACEYSGKVRNAFIKKGHDAISCDLLPSESPGPHHQGDIKDILYSENWDLIVAHPPCTRLCNSGVMWLAKRNLWDDLKQGAEFFKLFLDHPCEKNSDRKSYYA
jgi:hypothetical protein